MALDARLAGRLRLPAICAPMFLVSGPDLVREACKAGLMGGLPRHNARTFEQFADWLATISEDLTRHLEEHPGSPVGPMAVNLSTRMPAAELDRHLVLCRRFGVEIIISAAGDPTELTKRAHDHDLQVFHDVTSLRFAEKALSAGVDGMTCIGSGGGGKSGTLNHFALVPRVRAMFDGTIVLAGSVGNGAAIRAAEVLGADLAYLGTRFIAAQESMAPLAYKQMLVDATAADLVWTADVVGVPGNWLTASLREVGLDPTALPPATGQNSRHLPPTVRPWKDVWSAGQGVELIDDIPPVAVLADRLEAEYLAACAVPPWTERRLR